MRRTVFGRKKNKVILHLPFQNNFSDFGEMGLTMVAGGTSNQPTFALSGRKANEYCAVFNGLQSIKTTTNLPINSDKVTIEFAMKTTQTGAAVVVEMSVNTNNIDTNAFNTTINETAGKIRLYDAKYTQFNIGNSTANINDGTWKHIILTINRSQGINSNSIYINGVLSYSPLSSPYNKDNDGTFANAILFIAQRSGSSNGYNGSLMSLKIYNHQFSASDATAAYNNWLL